MFTPPHPPLLLLLSIGSLIEAYKPPTSPPPIFACRGGCIVGDRKPSVWMCVCFLCVWMGVLSAGVWYTHTHTQPPLLAQLSRPPRVFWVALTHCCTHPHTHTCTSTSTHPHTHPHTHTHTHTHISTHPCQHTKASRAAAAAPVRNCACTAVPFQGAQTGKKWRQTEKSAKVRTALP